ncbi:MAG: Flp family type IVb pilin [Alphaproteobacteria bacterium]|nr:Flp family type IVb pilin [Alphaproteobacteria bacterium]
MKKRFLFSKNEDGATAIEYAFIASIVGVGIISGLQLLPPALNAVFAEVASYF